MGLRMRFGLITNYLYSLQINLHPRTLSTYHYRELTMHTTPNAERYDRLTRSFHWLTVALVIFLFASAQVWDILEKGTPLRKEIGRAHV